MADEGVQLQSTLANTQREADEHARQRTWLEKKLGTMGTKLALVQGELDGSIEHAKELDQKIAALQSELELEKIKVIEHERGATQVRKTPSWPRSWANFSLS